MRMRERERGDNGDYVMCKRDDVNFDHQVGRKSAKLLPKERLLAGFSTLNRSVNSDKLSCLQWRKKRTKEATIRLCLDLELVDRMKGKKKWYEQKKLYMKDIKHIHFPFTQGFSLHKFFYRSKFQTRPWYIFLVRPAHNHWTATNLRYTCLIYFKTTR